MNWIEKRWGKAWCVNQFGASLLRRTKFGTQLEQAKTLEGDACFVDRGRIGS